MKDERTVNKIQNNESRCQKQENQTEYKIERRNCRYLEENSNELNPGKEGTKDKRLKKNPKTISGYPHQKEVFNLNGLKTFLEEK